MRDRALNHCRVCYLTLDGHVYSASPAGEDFEALTVAEEAAWRAWCAQYISVDL